MKTATEGSRVSERGFTLIELLLVIAILGVLAAVAIPNVGRFLGAGKKEEPRQTELRHIQTAVTAMMVDNGLSRLPNPIDTVATNDMAAFPDATSDWGAVGGKSTDLEGIPYGPEDTRGYLRYGQ